MTITIPSGTASPWARAPIRVFISHATSQVEEATKLRSALRKLGCDPFVAHRDIEARHSMDCRNQKRAQLLRRTRCPRVERVQDK